MKDTKTSSEQIFNRPPRKTTFLGPMVGKLPSSGGGGKTYTFERPLFCSTDNHVSLKYNNTDSGKLILRDGLLDVDYTNAVDNTNKLVESQAVYNAIALLQPKTDNDLQTTSKNVVDAINELKARLDKMEIKVGGFYASTTKYTSQELHDLVGYGTWENICDAPNHNYLYVKAVKSTEQANVIGSQSLPNISGTLNLVGGGSSGFWGNAAADSAIYSSNQGSSNYFAASSVTSSGVTKFVNIDLKRNNSIYQDGADVHPNNYSIYLYRRIA